MCAGYENEKNAERDSKDKEDPERHGGALRQQGTDIGLANARPVHESVLAKAEKGHDGVHLVLVAHEEIATDCEGENDLRLGLAKSSDSTFSFVLPSIEYVSVYQ